MLKNRLSKLETKMKRQEEKVYVIDPFGEKGEEVVVSGIDSHRRISLEEFEKIDTSKENVI